MTFGALASGSVASVTEASAAVLRLASTLRSARGAPASVTWAWTSDGSAKVAHEESAPQRSALRGDAMA
jgi:hypothetical protein